MLKARTSFPNELSRTTGVRLRSVGGHPPSKLHGVPGESCARSVCRREKQNSSRRSRRCGFLLQIHCRFWCRSGFQLDAFRCVALREELHEKPAGTRDLRFGARSCGALKMALKVDVLRRAAGIENNGGRNFKDLREMRRNAKSLNRNDREHKRIVIAPLVLPRFSCSLGSLRCGFRLPRCKGMSAPRPNLAARMAGRQEISDKRNSPNATCQVTTLLRH